MPLNKFDIERKPPSDAVRDFVRENKLIAAIKAYREQYPGTGLEEAVEVIEAIRLSEQSQRQGGVPDGRLIG